MRRLYPAALMLATAFTSAATTVTPSGAEVPANLLKIELAFDKALTSPMDMDHVALLDHEGHPIADAFLDLPLASRDGKHVTVLLHPGRIKTGVGPNVALGMALRQGQDVTLVISDPQLTAPLKKTWQVQPALRTAIDPASWSIVSPVAGGRDPLLILLKRTLVTGAGALIALAAPDGQRVMGRATLDLQETRWRFVPDRPWQGGRYTLRVHPSLEDPEGNRVCSAFEQIGQSEIACDEDVRLPLTISAPASSTKAGVR